MITLSIDTSAKASSCALFKDEKLLCLYSSDDGLTHSASILNMINSIVSGQNLSPSDIDFFVLTKGPGSFTGLRIGMSIIKGFAFALDKPCFAVSTLEAMAQCAYTFCKDGIICAAMDARRNEVYNALYDAKTMTPLCFDRALSLEELSKELNELSSENKIFLLGDGAKLCYNYMQEKKIPTTVLPSLLNLQLACGAFAFAYPRFLAGESLTAGALSPTYLRLSQAERERQENNKKTN